jgi:ribonuclease D
MTSTWIETSAELEALLSAHRGRESVAVDTEFRRRDTFYPQVALLQLCWGDAAYLIDPLQLDELDALRGFLTNPAQIKCLHSASEDLEVFEHWLQVLPSPLFDTQRAAALEGWEEASDIALLWRSFLKWTSPRKRHNQIGCSAL